MTDTSPGPGWWLASDGQWYPPHLHPDVRARPESTVDTLEDAPDDRDASVTLDVTDDDVTTGAGSETTPAADERPNGHGHNGASNGWVVGDDAPAADAEDAEGATVADERLTAPETVAVAATGAALPTQYVPEREPIDWARVAEERAARRQANESRRRRKWVGATLASIGTLAVLVAVARNDGNDDRTASTGDTEVAQDDTATTTTDAATSSSEVPSTTSVAPVTTAAGSVSVFALLPGTCVSNADLSSGLVTTVTEVPCDQPHTHEVYHKVTYTPPDGAYDAARISQFASEQCSQSFASYVGIPYDRSKYYFLNFAPTEESWTQKGDREVVCLLFLQGSQLTGSAKGTAQ